MKKQVIALFLILTLVATLIACGTQQTEPSTSSPAQTGEQAADATEPSDAADPVDTEKQVLQDGLAEKIGRITFREDLPGDKTGNWRVALINYDGNIIDYVLDYYKAYFNSDDEVHFLVNQADDRTVRVNAYGTTILCTVLERVDGGDFNAQMVNTGAEIGSYQITVETGEVKQLS